MLGIIRPRCFVKASPGIKQRWSMVQERKGCVVGAEDYSDARLVQYLNAGRQYATLHVCC